MATIPARLQSGSRLVEYCVFLYRYSFESQNGDVVLILFGNK